MEKEVKIGELYKHFKGHIYKVICLANNADDLRKQVVYQEITDENKIWVRDFDEFTSPVDKEKYPDIVQSDRFELLRKDNK